MTPDRPERDGDARLASTHTDEATDRWHDRQRAPVVEADQFAPGVVLHNRYRVATLVGRGGMGEVYRADDLRLGQTVALKFLPKAVAGEPARLARLHDEVRIARQVAHPNVCRVYDIDDHEGRVFLSMEFVGGEDLGASLRRLGRPPEGRALAISLEICAGLAAAHDSGVVHRDLKPSNIMLDPKGHARLMDFGIAVLADRGRDLAGTPAYMAPEQIRGEPATTRSDIYALGLVLYELFVGQRAIAASSFAERRDGPHDPVTPPTALVRGLDPMIEQAILLCLDPRPDRRPTSARAVAALFERVDPLANALAGGETPAPEVVAAAGHVDRALSPRAGVLWMLALVVGLLAGHWASERATVVGQIDVDKPLPVLTEGARQVRTLAGRDDPLFERRGLAYDTDVISWAARQSGVRRGALPSVRFWLSATEQRVPVGSPLEPSFGAAPAPGGAKDTTVEMDLAGRLRRFRGPVPQPAVNIGRPTTAFDWRPWFAAAALDATRFGPPATQALQATPGTRYSWQRDDALPDGQPDRVQGEVHQGVATLFVVGGPWSMTEVPVSRRQEVAEFVSQALSIALVVLAIVMAARNTGRARGDREGVVRIALVTFSVAMVGWAVSPGHVADLAAEGTRLYYALGYALLSAAVIGGTYVGFEPFVRRYWPRALLGWSRLVRGRASDPLVGRDVLVGLTLGTVSALIMFGYQLVPRLFGWAEPAGWLVPLPAADGLWPALAVLAHNFNWSVINGVFGLFIVAALRHVLGRMVLSMVLSVIVFALLGDPATTMDLGRPLHFLVLCACTVPTVYALTRWGLLAGVSAAFSTNAMTNAVFTLDRSRALADVGLLYAGIILITGLIAWRIALGRIRAPAIR